jgi:hypothetical protein
VSQSNWQEREDEKTNHQTLSSYSLGQSGFNDSIHEDDLRQFDSKIILVPVR